MSTTSTPGPGPSLAEELRRRRTALGWTLEEVASRAQVSVALLSLIERGKRQPSVRSWGRIRQVLGIAEPLPRQAWEREVGEIEITEELVATLGACLAAVRHATLAELAEASGASLAGCVWPYANSRNGWNPRACRSSTTATRCSSRR